MPDERWRTDLGQVGGDVARNADVVVREVEVISGGWHVLRRTTFDLRRGDGTWTTQSHESHESHESHDTGDAATLLLPDTVCAAVLLTRKFRFPAHAGGHRGGLLIETAAGTLGS